MKSRRVLFVDAVTAGEGSVRPAKQAELDCATLEASMGCIIGPASRCFSIAAGTSSIAPTHPCLLAHIGHRQTLSAGSWLTHAGLPKGHGDQPMTANRGKTQPSLRCGVIAARPTSRTRQCWAFRLPLL